MSGLHICLNYDDSDEAILPGRQHCCWPIPVKTLHCVNCTWQVAEQEGAVVRQCFSKTSLSGFRTQQNPFMTKTKDSLVTEGPWAVYTTFRKEKCPEKMWQSREKTWAETHQSQCIFSLGKLEALEIQSWSVSADFSSNKIIVCHNITWFNYAGADGARVRPQAFYLCLLMELKGQEIDEWSWYSGSDKEMLNCKYICIMIQLQQPNGSALSHY